MPDMTSQRSWYEYYIRDADHTDIRGLMQKVEGNKFLQPYVRQIILDALQRMTLPSRGWQYDTRQSDVCITKYCHGFNVSDIQKDFEYLQGEVDEAKEAIFGGDSKEHQVEELADIVIYCYGMAQMLGLNLDDAIFKKMQYNATRKYETDLE